MKRIFGFLNTPVSGITSDNAADMVTVIAHLKWPHIFIVTFIYFNNLKKGIHDIVFKKSDSYFYIIASMGMITILFKFCLLFTIL